MSKILIVSVLLVPIMVMGGAVPPTQQSENPEVVWYVVAKWLQPDFMSYVDAYKPDSVILTVFAEDDVQPLNGSKEINLTRIVDQLHERNVSVYFGYSLYSRSMYEEIKHTNLSVEEYLHVSSYARYLRETDQERYHELFDYYTDRGLDPESIPKVSRKPVDGYYVEIGHNSMTDPLYQPYQDFLVGAINETLNAAKPDGLAFDHIRFFTFDAGYNPEMREYILQECGLDIYGYSPQPPFVLDRIGWTRDDRAFYDCKAMMIRDSVDYVIRNFPEYEKWGTTMGMIDPARANGQYVEMQSQIFDGLLLMAYDRDPNEIARNVRETKENAGGKRVILGISKLTEDTAVDNVKAGLENGADGIYLLGYHFDEGLHRYLLDIRKKDA
jgi:hypothetical protein